MTRTRTVAAAIALLFCSGVASAIAMSTHEAAELAVPATVAAPTTTTTTTRTTTPTTSATAPLAAPIADAPKSAVALKAALVAPKPVPKAPKPAAVAPKPAPAAPQPASIIPVVAPPVPLVAPPGPPGTTTTVPQFARPVCTDTSLDQKQVIPANSSLDQTKSYLRMSAASRATVIGSYATCVAEGGAIDPRHDDVNGDGDYCGGDIPVTAVGFSAAADAQLDCQAELASREDF